MFLIFLAVIAFLLGPAPNTTPSQGGEHPAR
jgi:hypothetical protein